MSIDIIDAQQLDGIMIVLTEMALQNYDTSRIADIISPMGLSSQEIHYMLESCDPTWRESQIDYLVAVYTAWLEAEAM